MNWGDYTELRAFDAELAADDWNEEIERRVHAGTARDELEAEQQLGAEWTAYRIHQFEIGQKAIWRYRKDAFHGSPFHALEVTVVGMTDKRIQVACADHKGDIRNRWVFVDHVSPLTEENTHDS